MTGPAVNSNLRMNSDQRLRTRHARRGGTRLTDSKLEHPVAPEPGVGERASVTRQERARWEQDQEADRAQHCMRNDHLLVRK